MNLPCKQVGTCTTHFWEVHPLYRHTTRATQAVQTLEKLLTVADPAEILGLSSAKIYELTMASPRTKSGERGLID